MSWLLAGVLLVYQVTGATPPPPPKSEEVGIGSLGRVSPGRPWLCASCFLLHPQCLAEGLGLSPTGSMGASARGSPGHQRASESMICAV